MNKGDWSIGMRQLNIDAVQKIFADKDAKIERLSRDNAFYGSNDYVHSLKVLLTRAADALETESWPSKHHDYSVLITELRKAAE